MSEDHRDGSNDRALVVKSTGGLALRSAGLVKRGLGLLESQKPENRLIRLVIGNLGDAQMNRLLVRLVERAGDGHYAVTSVATDSIEELTAHAQDEQTDLFVVIANNLVSAPLPRRMQTALELVSVIKTNNKRVIVLTGLADPTFPEKALHAGADAFFSLPVDPAGFVEAVKKLLSLST